MYIIYVIEDSITHNLMGRGFDTEGYTILRNVFKHGQEKNREKPGRW
jgi:hypothetical protein